MDCASGLLSAHLRPWCYPVLGKELVHVGRWILPDFFPTTDALVAD